MAGSALLPLTFLVLLSAVVVDSVTISGKVVGTDGGGSAPPNHVFPGQTSSLALGGVAGPHTHGSRVVLDGHREVYASSLDGGFSFSDVAPGLHSVEVFHRDFVFATHKVVVEEGKEPLVQRFLYPGAPQLDSKLPLEVFPVTLVQHFEDRPPSAMWGMLQSPMVWIGLLMVGAMVAMQGVDKEELKKVSEEQQEQCAIM
jgi:hypothetical protein